MKKRPLKPKQYQPMTKEELATMVGFCTLLMKINKRLMAEADER